MVRFLFNLQMSSDMDNAIFTLDPNYSTTRLVSTIPPKIEDHPDAKFKTHLFLPEGEGRQGEGGLRTKGYFKHSYEVVEGHWYITDNFGLSEDDAKKIPVDQDQVPDALLEYVRKELREADQESDTKGSGEHYSPEHFKLPLITVITVVFNGEKHLAETIESVVNQTYPNVEYIIIDGCSTDDTLDIVKSYEERIDYWVSEKDRGIYNAMNKSLNLMTGRSALFLNSGDLLYSNTTISDVVRCNEIDKNFIMGYTKISYCNSSYVRPKNINNVSKFKIKSYPTHQAVFFPVRWHKQNIYDEAKNISADIEIINKALSTGQCKTNEGIISSFLLGGISNDFSSINKVFFHAKEAMEVRCESKFCYFWIFCLFMLKYILNKFFTKKSLYRFSMFFCARKMTKNPRKI